MKQLIQLQSSRSVRLAVFMAFLVAVGQGLIGLGGPSPVHAQTGIVVAVGGPYSATVGTAVIVAATVSGATTPQFFWNFGDGSSAATQVAAHVYSTGGTYPVTITVVDLSNGHTGSASTTAVITGGSTLVTVSAGGPYGGTVGSAVTMAATVSGATNPQFTWSFGDGATGTGQVATHSYSAASTYPVTVTVLDLSSGASGSAGTTAAITLVTAGALTVSAGGPYSGAAGVSLTMSATASGAITPGFTWSFGDGTTGYGQVTTHIYTTATTYSVSVTVIDGSTGKSGSASTTASISGTSAVSAGGPYSGAAGVSLTMSATASGAITPSFTWSFGDGTTGYGQVTTHVYTTATTYSVSVTVIDGSTGVSGSASTTASISGTSALQYCNGTYISTTVVCSSYNATGAYYCNGTYVASAAYCNTAASTSAYSYPSSGAYAPSSALGSSGSLGCSSGVPPCAAGQTCTPSGANSVLCSYSGAPATTSLAAQNAALAARSTAATTASSYAQPPTSSSTATSQTVAVTYPAGWNLIAGAAGVTLPAASIVGGPYAFPAGSGDYQTVPAGQPLQNGQGYWVDFSTATTINLPATSVPQASQTLPAGQYVLIGDSMGIPMTVSGADAVFVYDPSSSTYKQTSSLSPGQGAWAYSTNGAVANFSQPATTASPAGS